MSRLSAEVVEVLGEAGIIESEAKGSVLISESFGDGVGSSYGRENRLSAPAVIGPAILGSTSVLGADYSSPAPAVAMGQINGGRPSEGDYCCCHQGARPKTRVTSSSSGGSRSGGSRSGGSSPDARSLEEKSDRSHRLKFKKPNGVTTTTTTAATRCAKPFVNGSPSPDLWEVNQLKKDLEMSREELGRSRILLADLRDRERKMKDRLAEQAQKMLEKGVRFENVSMGERRPTALIRKYGNLYAQARVDTLDALDALDELRDGDELKSKLLFSVVVLAFRSVQANLLEIKSAIRRALQIPDSTTSVAELPPSARELESSVNSFLRDTIERFDVRKCVEEVCSQIWATLYDYPCLKGCDGLIQYVRDCVRLAWGLANQHPPFVIEYETRAFRRDMHVRFHASNQDSPEIKTYLWPALLEGQEGPCVHKGVVVT